MFHKKSDFTENRRDSNRIVYQTVNGPIHLTRQDFDSEAEFQRWKEWSDQNYHEMEQENRFSDRHLEMNEYIEATAVLLDFVHEARAEGVSEQALQIQSFQLAYQYGKRTLTKTQQRRLALFARGMKVGELAKAEGVPHQDISKSIAAAKRKLIKFINKL